MSLEKVGVLVTGNQNTGQTQKTDFPSAAAIQPAKRLLSDGYFIPTLAPEFAQLLSDPEPSHILVRRLTRKTALLSESIIRNCRRSEIV
jgi:hypothetical protein